MFVNQLHITKDTKVYVLCPAQVATGGPELLHQLVYTLRNTYNIDAYMYYLPNDLEEPRHETYKQYYVPFSRELEDDAQNVMIIPEVMTNELQKFNKIQKAIWWLSIDMYFITLKGRKGKLNKSLCKRGFKCHFFFDKKLKEVDLHLAQSYYAEAFLRKKGINNIVYLSDYLNQDFLNIQTDLSKKENIVAYNPSKGYKFTKQIIEHPLAEGLSFVPIKNMTREQVIELLQKAKIYIDFGYHPGKDRIPREAAILGCCVITNRMGSANFQNDVNIPEKFKFNSTKKMIPTIIDTIKHLMQNFESEHSTFDPYRQSIQQEHSLFLKDVGTIFKVHD